MREWTRQRGRGSQAGVDEAISRVLESAQGSVQHGRLRNMIASSRRRGTWSTDVIRRVRTAWGKQSQERAHRLLEAGRVSGRH
jgi:hypothetical protein